MKAAVGYIFTLILGVLFTLYIDGHAGVVFLAVLITAPFISILITLWAKRKISFSARVSASVLNKGDSVTFTAVFKKNGIIPAPFIEMTLNNTVHFEGSGRDKFRISLNSKKDEVITRTYAAKIWGEASVGIFEIVITDFLGLVSFNIFRETGLRIHTARLEILPDLRETPAKNELLQSVCDAVAYDDNEETKENSVSLIGFPGYEHKKYSAGDPIKKINWKLSSKRDELLVRLDEAFASSKLNIFIDCVRRKPTSENDLKIILNEEKIIESALSMIKLIISLGLECNVYFYGDNKQQHRLVSDMGGVNSLRYEFVKCKFLQKRNNSSRIPPEINTDEHLSSLMAFTTCFDKELEAELDLLSHEGTAVHTVVGEIPAEPQGNLWLVNNNFEFLSI